MQGRAEAVEGEDTTDESEEESSHAAHRTREILQAASQVSASAQPESSKG